MAATRAGIRPDRHRTHPLTAYRVWSRARGALPSRPPLGWRLSSRPPLRKMILQMHTPALTSRCWSRQTPAWTGCVHLDAPGQRHGQQPVSGTADPGVVKQDKSSRDSIDTTKTRSDPQRVGMYNGERPIGAAKGKQTPWPRANPPAPQLPEGPLDLRIVQTSRGLTYWAWIPVSPAAQQWCPAAHSCTLQLHKGAAPSCTQAAIPSTWTPQHLVDEHGDVATFYDQPTSYEQPTLYDQPQLYDHR